MRMVSSIHQTDKWGSWLLISTQQSMPFGGLHQPLQMERLILHLLVAAVKQIVLLRFHTRAYWSQDATGHRPDMTSCTTETIKVLLMSPWTLSHERQPGILELYWCYCAKCFSRLDMIFVSNVWSRSRWKFSLDGFKALTFRLMAHTVMRFSSFRIKALAEIWPINWDFFSSSSFFPSLHFAFPFLKWSACCLSSLLILLSILWKGNNSPGHRLFP